jgi:hypothetical protein
MYKNPVNSYPANAAFNKANSPLNASDYIQYKKTVYSFCSPNLCKPNKNVGPSSNLQLLKVANNAAFYPCKDSFDNTQLYSNLYTELNLRNTIPSYIGVTGTFPDYINGCPPTLNNAGESIPSYKVIIDPSGNLFGNTICNTQGWQNYVVYNSNV